MIQQTIVSNIAGGISDQQLFEAITASLADARGCLRRVLLIPPDHTRIHSCGGRIANLYYHVLKNDCQVDILPALGTHLPLTWEEAAEMFGDVPFDRFLVHDWRRDVVKLGEVPADFVCSVSEGLMNQPIEVEVNRRLVDGDYDLILSIGQVVPHEVVGMANYTKNILVGCGGSRMINASHSLGAFYGLERIMGRTDTPVRRVFDYAQEHFLSALPLTYVLTVTTAQEDQVQLRGLFVGGGRDSYLQAAELSRKTNLTLVDQPLQRVVVALDAGEFKSTWLGNKAIYRTRMAIADGGELIVLAPGIRTFGEDSIIDGLIRKYGYCGREKIMRLVGEHPDLAANMSAAAHLIHGSADGRFRVVFCARHLTEQEVRSVGFDYLPYDEACIRYTPATAGCGYRELPEIGPIYYIDNPALGLWASRDAFSAHS